MAQQKFELSPLLSMMLSKALELQLEKCGFRHMLQFNWHVMWDALLYAVDVLLVNKDADLARQNIARWEI